MAERLHRCDHCSKAFTQKYNLKVHLRIHAEDRPFVCGSCGKAFTQLGNLHVHEATHTGLQPHACPHCPFRTGLSSSLRRHIGRHHVKETVQGRKEDLTGEATEKDEIECDVCHVLFTSLLAFERHRKSHPHMQPDRRYLCSECNYSTDDRTQLGNHLLTHSGEKPHQCDLCGKAFALKSYLKVHLRHHTGERPFICDICGKGFTRKDSLRVHERTHSGEKPYLCGICGKNFTSLSSLQVHNLSHTMKKISPDLHKDAKTLEGRDVKHFCSFCSAGFLSPSELQLHVNAMHSAEEKKETYDVAKKEKEAFVCDVCNVLVSSLSALEGHKKTHRQPNQKRRHTECDDAAQLELHMLAHRCSLCGKAFTRKGHLKRHIETHLGESPHACNTCGKRFTRVDNLRKHEKTHTKVLISSISSWHLWTRLFKPADENHCPNKLLS